MPRPPPQILPVIVLSQFAAAALWFASNGVVGDLQQANGLPPEALGYLTIAVQLGFITGALIFAYFAIADTYSPRFIFLACALTGAVTNLGLLVDGASLGLLLGSRFATGVCLAGIYPIGMKIAAGWYDTDLGRSLGYLVGALVLGTALPHLVRALGHELAWENVILIVSAVAVAGGILMALFVSDGPHQKPGGGFDPSAFTSIFGSPDFRASAFGYFGHMWELYAFWVFVPVFLAAYAETHSLSGAFSIPVWSFVVIAAGALGCVGGGLIAARIGSGRVAFAQLATSCLCCLLSPFAFLAPVPVMLAFLIVWGVTVAGDSPQFSTMNARAAPPDRVGSALTIANCIGFAITVVSIQVLNMAASVIGPQYLFLILVPGPVLGLLALRRMVTCRDDVV